MGEHDSGVPSDYQDDKSFAGEGVLQRTARCRPALPRIGVGLREHRGRAAGRVEAAGCDWLPEPDLLPGVAVRAVSFNDNISVY
jgi:hypothetical protein